MFLKSFFSFCTLAACVACDAAATPTYTYSCLPGIKTSTANLQTNLALFEYYICGDTDGTLDEQPGYVANDISNSGYRKCSNYGDNETIIYSYDDISNYCSWSLYWYGFFGPSEPGWYEIQVTYEDSSEICFYGENSLTEDKKNGSYTSYSVMVYADGSDSSGVTALYPMRFSSSEDFLIVQVLKDGVAVNPNSVFYNNYNDGEIKTYVDAQKELFGSFSTICPTSSTSTAASTSATSPTSSVGDPTHLAVSFSVTKNANSIASSRTTLDAAELPVRKSVSSSTSNITTSIMISQTTLDAAETVVNKVLSSSTSNSTIIGTSSTAASFDNNSSINNKLAANQSNDGSTSNSTAATVSYISTTILTSHGAEITEGIAVIATALGNSIHSYTTSLPVAPDTLSAVISAGSVSSSIVSDSSATPHLLEAVDNNDSVSPDTTQSNTTLAAIAVSSASISSSSESAINSINLSSSGSLSRVFQKWIMGVLTIVLITLI